MPTKTKTAAILADSLKEATCNGRSCGAPIVWATFAKSGKKGCFNGPIEGKRGILGDRQVIFADLSRIHWDTCPDAKSFKREGNESGAGRSPTAVRTATTELLEARKILRHLWQHPEADFEGGLRDAGGRLNKALAALGYQEPKNQGRPR